MNVLILSVVCGFLMMSGVASGQSVLTQQAIEARLQKAPFLMLRGRYAGTQLNFDAQGNLVGSAKPEQLSLSALRVTSVHLSSTQLQIVAIREGLGFGEGRSKKGLETAKPVAEIGNLSIVISVDPQHPETLDAAIDKVFSVGFDEAFANAAPDYWRPWLEHELHPDLPYPVLPPGTFAPGATHPHLVYSTDPQFSYEARRLGYGGICMIQLIIGADGKPRDISILHPLGMGLDEFAVLAVNQYRFEPGKHSGTPVPVAITIEVNFRT